MFIGTLEFECKEESALIEKTFRDNGLHSSLGLELKGVDIGRMSNHY